MQLIDDCGSFTIYAADNTDYSLVFSEGIISCVNETGHIEAEFYVDDIPTMQVVYCKDCKYRTEFGKCKHPRQHGILPTAYPYDFCSYGWARKGWGR